MKLVNIHILTILFLFFGRAAQAQVWSINQCIDAARSHNKNLKINQNNALIGEQKHKEAVANLIPKVTVNADYKYFTNLPYQLLPLSTFNSNAPEGQFKEAQFGVPHNINTTGQAAIPIYNPQVYGAIQTTKIATELTKLQYQKAEETLFFDISNLYYNAQILKNQLVFIDSNLVNTQKLLSNMRLLRGLAMAKGTDVSKVELQADQLATQRLNMQSKYEQVINALKFAMGLSLDKPLSIDPEIKPNTEGGYSATSTLDMRLATIQNKLLNSELTTLKISRLPSVSLVGAYGYTGFGYDKQPNDFLKFFPIGFLGVQVSYPLFNGTVTQLKINQKKYDIQNNELQAGLINEQNAMQVANIKLQANASQKTIETTQQQIKLAQAIYNKTLLQQKQGVATLTDVLLADNAHREAQQAYLNAVIDYLKADLEWKKLTGNFLTNNKN